MIQELLASLEKGQKESPNLPGPVFPVFGSINDRVTSGTGMSKGVFDDMVARLDVCETRAQSKGRATSMNFPGDDALPQHLYLVLDWMSWKQHESRGTE